MGSCSPMSENLPQEDPASTKTNFTASQQRCCDLLGVRAALFFQYTQAPARGEAGAALETPSPSPAPFRKLHHGKRSTEHPPWQAPHDPWDNISLHCVGSAQGPHSSLDASPLAVTPTLGSRGHTTQARGTQRQQEHLPVQVMNKVKTIPLPYSYQTTGFMILNKDC